MLGALPDAVWTVMESATMVLLLLLPWVRQLLVDAFWRGSAKGKLKHILASEIVPILSDPQRPAPKKVSPEKCAMAVFAGPVCGLE